MQIQQHRNEAAVIQLAALKDKLDRIMCVTILGNKGNHLHNCDVLRAGQGDFLVTYRRTNADNYRLRLLILI